jgi:two-component system, response regulator
MSEKTVLLVEDNPDDEALTLSAFESSGVPHVMVVVRDGAEALDYLFAQGAHAGRDTAALPSLVLMDLKLPKYSGLEVMERMRADPRTRLVPVVVLSSSDEPDDQVKSYRLGVNSYVRKSIDFDQFARGIHMLAEYWLVLNQGVR